MANAQTFPRFPRAISLVLIALVLGVAARGQDNWVKVATEHFTILTPASESSARRWAIEFEQFRRALQVIIPVAEGRLRPVTVVVFTNDRQMAPYAPLERGKPMKIGGIFVRAHDINAIMLSLSGDAAETRHVIFHEAVHWHLSALDASMPLWLGEGLAELYATFDLRDDNTYAFGEPMPGYIARLRREPLLPLTDLLSISRNSLLYNEGTRASIFYAQAWAFAHFLFYGDASPGREAVVRYLEMLKAGEPQEGAFKKAFGGTYTEIEARLRRYVREGSYRRHVYSRAASGIEKGIVAKIATPAEIELARGALLFGTRTPESADAHLRRAAVLAPQDPRPWELLGHAAVVRRDFDEAESLLSKAAAVGSTSYLVYHNLAVSRLPQPVVRELGPSGTDLDRAAADYRRAIELSPSHVPSYEGLAGLIYGMEAFVPADLERLARGLAQAPDNTMIEAGLAAAEIRAGHEAEGRARLERVATREGEPAAPADGGVNFARQVLADETLKAELAAVEEHGRHSRFAEALALIDRALQRDLSRQHRHTLVDLHAKCAAYQQLAEAIEIANQGRTAEAMKLLEGLSTDSPEFLVRGEAQRVLGELRKRGVSGATP